MLSRPWCWFAAAVVIGTLVRLPQLLHPATGPYAFRLAQTAMGAREYARHGVDLLSSPLPIFGVVDNVPFEFPLFQAIVSELMRLGPDATLAARIAGLVSFQLVAILWGVLLHRWVGTWVAVGTVVLLEFLPFGLLWGAAPLIDFFSVALGLGMVLALESWMRGGRWPLLALGAVTASLLFLVKVTTVPAAGILLLVSVALVVADRGWRTTWRRVLAALALGPGLALVPLVLWTRRADEIKAESPTTTFLTSSALTDWNFGTWDQRTDPETWQRIAERVTNEIAGIGLLALVAGLVLAIAFGGLRHRVVLAGLVAGTLAPVLIFFNLYWVHTYYLSAVFPLLCAIPVLGIAALATRFDRPLVVLPVAGVVGALLLTTFALPLGRADVTLTADPGPIPAISRSLRQVTPADARVVLVGCDWSPEFLYEADRTGLMFRTQTPAQAWAENDIGDYAFIARCDSALDPAEYLPEGYGISPSRAADVFRIVTAN